MIDYLNNEYFFIKHLKHSIIQLVTKRILDGRIKLNNLNESNLIIEKAFEFYLKFHKMCIPVSNGLYKVYFSFDKRSLERPEIKSETEAWAEYSIHAVTSSGKMINGCNYSERIYNQTKVDALSYLETIIKKEQVTVALRKNEPEMDSIVFLGQIPNGKYINIITRLDKFGDATSNLTEITVVVSRKMGKSIKLCSVAEAIKTVSDHQKR